MRKIIAVVALTAAALVPAAPAFAFNLNDYVEETIYCTNYSESEEYTAIVDGKTKVIGRDYKGRAYEIFPVNSVTGADGRLINRDTNVKQWQRFFKFLVKHVECENRYYNI